MQGNWVLMRRKFEFRKLMDFFEGIAAISKTSEMADFCAIIFSALDLIGQIRELSKFAVSERSFLKVG